MLPINQTQSLPLQRYLIPISIETLAGSSFELLVSPYEQIQYIKRKIERREGIPASHQHLIWKCNELEDESCLYDYQIEAGTRITLVLAMRGGPINTKRIPIEDNFMREMSEYIENNRENGSDLLSSSSSTNKNVTFLVLRDGDQFNFFQVIDRGDGTLSPLSTSMSNVSMYNAHETVTVESERKCDEKRQADNRKTKQKMELIRSRLKTQDKKDIVPLRPVSSRQYSKTNLIHHRHIDSTSNVNTNDDNLSSKQRYSPSYQFSTTNFSNTYNILTTSAIRQSTFLHGEGSNEDNDEDDDDYKRSNEILTSSLPHTLFDPKKEQLLTSRSFSPSIFNETRHHTSKEILFNSHHQDHDQRNRIDRFDIAVQDLTTIHPSSILESTSQEMTIITNKSKIFENDINTDAAAVDYVQPALSTLDKQSSTPLDRSSTPIHSSTTTNQQLHISDESKLNKVNCTLDNQDEKINSNNEIISQESPIFELFDDDTISMTHDLTSATFINDDKTEIYRKATAEIQSRNDTSLSKPVWTDDDDQLVVSDEYMSGERTLTSHSMRFNHQNSSTSTTIVTPLPTFPNVAKRSIIPSSTQQFYHYHQTLNNDKKQMKSSSKPLIPLTLSKYKRISINTHLTSSQQNMQSNTSNITSNDVITNENSKVNTGNEHLTFNKHNEILKIPNKKKSSSSTSKLTSINQSSRRGDSQRTVGTTSTIPSTSLFRYPSDKTEVAIETIGSKTDLRQHIPIEPVDLSCNIGKHSISLRTMASKEKTDDIVIEERYKLDSKLNNLRSSTVNHNSTIATNHLQSNLADVSNINKLPPIFSNRKSKSKCFLCKKKTGLATTYQCKCGSSFCNEHRYPEAHACVFDYKAEGKRLIERNNPLITASKLPKI